MTRIFLLILLGLINCHLKAQIAIINDADGFVNVRQGTSITSDIVAKILEGDMFFAFNDEPTFEWYYCWLSNNIDSIKPSKKENYVKNLMKDGKSVYIIGFIHKSRVQLICDLPLIKDQNRAVSKNSIRITTDSIDFELVKGPFIKENNTLNSSLYYIDGKNKKRVWGTDGEWPKQEIYEMSISINGKYYTLPEWQYEDLFEPNIESISLHYDYNGVIYINMPQNSDGAGGYDTVWRIMPSGEIDRYTDTL